MHITNRVPSFQKKKHTCSGNTDTHTCRFTPFSATFVATGENPHQAKRKNWVSSLFISRN